ncbi:hypothetical protein ACFOYW_14220 [Gryllotalpicola reticulitermitis]|uniref:Uncharacterized protein n=1 Tax=Gryllotalpicola reticulitermitis TaxID=1184153 RepID=A0ABV8QB39_9MICO
MRPSEAENNTHVADKQRSRERDIRSGDGPEEPSFEARSAATARLRDRDDDDRDSEHSGRQQEQGNRHQGLARCGGERVPPGRGHDLKYQISRAEHDRAAEPTVKSEHR